MGCCGGEAVNVVDGGDRGFLSLPYHPATKQPEIQREKGERKENGFMAIVV